MEYSTFDTILIMINSTMHLLPLTFLSCLLNVFFTDTSPSTQAKTTPSLTPSPITTTDVQAGASNIIFQSIDGGRTWQDISPSLPENIQPEGFFAGESGVYLRLNEVMYHSKSNLKTPVWQMETALNARSASIAFSRTGVIAYNEEGQIYQKAFAAETWLPIYSTFKEHSVQTIFETSDGTVLVGCNTGLYKSSDRGQTWKRIQPGGWAMDLAEYEGVLIGTSQEGIIRSTDGGEHWERVISEGGVGIAVERITGGFAVISYSGITKSRRIRISLDHGKTWQAIDDGLQPSLSISSIKQVGNYLLCGHPDGIFRSPDMGKTWYVVYPSVNNELNLGIPSYRSADTRKVFKLYRSGNVLYAMAKEGGC